MTRKKKKVPKKTTKEIHLHLTGEVNNDMCFRFFDWYSKLDFPCNLVIHICSGGGDVDTGFAIHDALRSWPWNVTTVGYGGVASIAVLIFAAGKERLTTKNTTFLIHPVSSTMDGTVKEVTSYVANVNRLHTNMVNGICERVTDPEFVIESANHDTFFSAEKALDIGLATGIVGFSD